MKALARVCLVLAAACFLMAGAAFLRGEQLQATLLVGSGVLLGIGSGLWWDER